MVFPAMVVALIVVGVIVFLAVDAYVIYRWIKSRLIRSPVPRWVAFIG